MSYLTPTQIDSFHRYGYLVLDRFWDGETVDKLRDKMAIILQGLDLTRERSIFSTKEQTRTSDEYFLESGYAIRYFWEEKAWVDGELVRPAELAINKVGHGLHDLDADFEAVTYETRVAQICRDLGMALPLAAQSMYIFKQPLIGGEVGAHQDGTFLYTEPQSVIGFWWALDDCSTSNGCLWAVPGSHALGVRRHFRRKASGEVGTEFHPVEPDDFDLTDAVPLEIPKGSLVLLHHALVHFSGGNTSECPRHAYSVHVVDGGDGVVYPKNNWLQRPPDHPFRPISI
jgi:phytanoyl-CoA hydroxylase